VLDREPTGSERQIHPRIATLQVERSYGASRTDPHGDAGRWLAQALLRLNGEYPIRLRTLGGSIPISPFVETLGIPAVTVPTVNAANNQHSPNENLRLGDFVHGIATMVAVLVEPRPAAEP
jgi:acetylornithine deacetylase/succinyl-diaminopimelate desuccinylase-like protein